MNTNKKHLIMTFKSPKGTRELYLFYINLNCRSTNSGNNFERFRFGIGLGVAYVWMIHPLPIINAKPSALRTDFKDEFRLDSLCPKRFPGSTKNRPSFSSFEHDQYAQLEAHGANNCGGKDRESSTTQIHASRFLPVR